MKILLLIDSLGAGGAQRQIVGLAVLLKQKGYDVTVAFYHDIPFYISILQQNKIPFTFLRQAENRFLRLWALTRYLNHVKYDVVISYIETPSICACIAKLINNSFKLIVSERNTSQCTGINEIIRFALFRVADYIVPNAYSQGDYILSHFPVLKNKIVTIPNFVDLGYFTPRTKSLRREVPEIIVVATVRASKNTLGFLDAVKKLDTNGIRFHISWYGIDASQTEYLTLCKQKISRLGLGMLIDLKEKTKEIKEKYQSADFFCLPSFYEGTPNVICEAMACGLPIACSDVCDNNRYVLPQQNGFLFDPKDSDSIFQALASLLQLNQERYDQYCIKSRVLAESLFSEDRFVESYIKLL